MRCPRIFLCLIFATLARIAAAQEIQAALPGAAVSFSIQADPDDARNLFPGPTIFRFPDATIRFGAGPTSPKPEIVPIFSGETNPEAEKKFADSLQHPLTAPIQITQTGNKARIVYDLAGKITGYAILQANERIESQGYLSGCSQPCAVLIQATGQKLLVSAGTPAADGKIRLKVFGNWAPAPGETRITSCVPKAGRTWIEFTAPPSTSTSVTLVQLPDPWLVRWAKKLIE